MLKSGNEEALEKLKALIENAQKQKIALGSLKPIKKRENVLKENFKRKVICLVFLLLAMYGTFEKTFLTEKVNFLITFYTALF